MSSSKLKLFCGSSNPQLGRRIAEELGISLGSVNVSRFPDGECNIAFGESVRAADVFLVQSTCYPVNDHIMELVLMADACKRASAARINAVIPYFGYSRQDRLDRKRAPISAKVVANMLTAAGVERVITVDVHAAQIQGFFDIPVDHLQRGISLLLDYLRGLEIPDPVVVAPDAGGVDRASEIAMGINGTMALIDRRRGSPAKARAMHLVGDVEGRECVLVDDIMDTGGTICEASDLLVTSGAHKVRAAATHPVLSGSCVERLNRSKVSELITTDTIPLPVEKQIDKITVVSIAPQLAHVIQNVHAGQSVLDLVDGTEARD
jgi:ribose-phosphate pyrophosphokinase